jgi:hypothetical protein
VLYVDRDLTISTVRRRNARHLTLNFVEHKHFNDMLALHVFSVLVTNADSGRMNVSQWSSKGGEGTAGRKAKSSSYSRLREGAFAK